MRSVVVLPAPFGPSRPRICPASQVRSTPSTTRFPPRCFTRPRASRSSGHRLPIVRSAPGAATRRARCASATGRLWHNRRRGPTLAPEAGDEKRIQGPRQRPAHDGARRALGAVSRRALQEVRPAVHPARGQCAEPAGDQDRRPRDRRDVRSGRARRSSARASTSAPSRATPTTRWRTRAATTPRRICRPWTSRASTSPSSTARAGRQVLMHDDLDPQVAAALARAHNNWTRDFCARDPAPAQVRRPARLPRRALRRRRGAARRARAGRGGRDRQPEPDQRPPRPRPRLRAAVGRGRGAGRARRLSPDRAVVARGRHRAPLRRHARMAG